MTANNINDKRPKPCGSGNICRLEAITPLVRRLNCLDIDKVAQICIDEIPKMIDANLASLYILDQASDILHLEKHNHPFTINNVVSLNQTPPSPMVAAVRSAQMFVVGNTETFRSPEITNTYRAFPQNYTSRSCIIAPLICQDRVIGVLNLTDKANNKEFTSEDVAAMELFRQLVGASICNINLFEKTQRQARTDGLTGMLNHKTFYETLELELRRARRFGSKTSIIMADIDNLKPANDNFGHRAGDCVIKQISRRISACIRQIDIAARYGGDEFAIILPNTGIEDAVAVAERMVKTVAESPVIWENHEMPLSISVGVGQYDANSLAGEVTKATDQAMYAAKQAGKNTVKVFAEAVS